MKNLNYPPFKGYILPKKNILVISCMDLRLTDNLVDFLHFDNLQNRYDHFILAGASLCCSAHEKKVNDYVFKKEVLDQYDSFKHWRRGLLEHVRLAVDLHQVNDVYIVEHQDCGAYASFLKDLEFKNPEEEIACHKSFAQNLADEIQATEYLYSGKTVENGKEVCTLVKHKLNVHGFFIDLRGDTELMFTQPAKH